MDLPKITANGHFDRAETTNLFIVKIIFAESSDVLLQWFSAFLLKRNPDKEFQWLEKPLCNILIVLYNLCNFWRNPWIKLAEP